MESTSSESRMGLHRHNFRIKVLEKRKIWLPIQLGLKSFGGVGAFVAVLHHMTAVVIEPLALNNLHLFLIIRERLAQERDHLLLDQHPDLSVRLQPL